MVKRTKPIIISVYENEGLVEKVTTGGFLGTIALTQEGMTFSGTGKAKGGSYPVVITVDGLGTVPSQKEYRGNDYVEKDVLVNALDGIDEDREERLSDEEKKELASISTVKLHQNVVDALEATPRVWSPFIDACQQADQWFDLPEMVAVPRYVEIEGNKAIGCAAVADINGARFLFGEAYFAHCTDGNDLYQFVAYAAQDIFPGYDEE